jgi:hypothetical protein
MSTNSPFLAKVTHFVRGTESGFLHHERQTLYLAPWEVGLGHAGGQPRALEELVQAQRHEHRLHLQHEEEGPGAIVRHRPRCGKASAPSSPAD